MITDPTKLTTDCHFSPTGKTFMDEERRCTCVPAPNAPATPVLVDGRDITRPGSVLFNQMPFVSWYPDHRLGPVVALDGDFTVEELRAIVAHIEKHLA